MRPQTCILLWIMSTLLNANQNEALIGRLSDIVPYAINEEDMESFKARLLRAKTWSEEDGEAKVVYTMIGGDGTRGPRLFIEKKGKLYMVEESHEDEESYAIYEIDEKNKNVKFLIEFKKKWFADTRCPI